MIIVGVCIRQGTLHVCRYGANITAVCESEAPARNLGGETLAVIKESMEKKVKNVYSV